MKYVTLKIKTFAALTVSLRPSDHYASVQMLNTVDAAYDVYRHTTGINQSIRSIHEADQLKGTLKQTYNDFSDNTTDIYYIYNK